jgi:hypothetical protein
VDLERAIGGSKRDHEGALQGAPCRAALSFPEEGLGEHRFGPPLVRAVSELPSDRQRAPDWRDRGLEALVANLDTRPRGLSRVPP